MQDTSSKQQTKIQTQSSADRITTSLSLAHQRKNKQTKTQHKSHTNHWPNLRKAETKRKKEFNLLEGKNATFLEAWEKETSNTVTFLKIMKRQRNTAQMKEKTRNIEVKINEEEIAKLPEKEFRIMIVKMTKNLENTMEKM